MGFMNRIANPFVRLLLRSPFHGMMSATNLLVTYRGRKSGRSYTLPVSYVRDEKTVIIVPGNPEHKSWWRNLRGGAAVTLRLAGREVSGTAAVIERDAAAAAGLLRPYLQAFPQSAKIYGVRIEEGRVNEADLLRAAEGKVVVRVELSSA